MKELLQPAISYARNGFPVTEVIAEGWARNARSAVEVPEFRRGLHAQWPRAGQGRGVPQSAARQHADRDRRTAGAMRSTRATSPGASKPTCAPTAVTSPPPTWRRTIPSGSSRSPLTTAATTCGSCRRTRRASRRCRCSTSSRPTTSRRWASAAPTTCTCSSRPRSSPSRTARVTTRIRSSRRFRSRGCSRRTTRRSAAR